MKSQSISRRARIVSAASLLCLFASGALAQVRIVTWNISNYDGVDRGPDIQNVLYGVVPVGLALAGQRMNPDILLLQEFTSSSALSTFVSVINTAPGSPGDWAAAPFVNGSDTDSVLVYRSSKFQLLNSYVIAVGVATTTDQPRNTMRYDVRPIGYTAPSTVVGMYNSHMKALESGTTADEARRQLEAQRIRSNANGVDTNPDNMVNDALPAGYNFLFAGDMNLQSSTDPGYVPLIEVGTGPGRFFDPVNTPGTWFNQTSRRFLHTQTPVGAGGMDDRFDQILISNSMKDTVGWHYIGSLTAQFSTTTWNDPNHSLRAWGNDGTSLNLNLTTTGNTMVGASIAQSIIVSAEGSGHIPAFCDFRIPAKAGSSVTTLNFGSVVQGDPAPNRQLTISNTGDVARFGANAIATLNYSLGTASGFSIPTGSFSDGAGGSGVLHTITMPTTTVGTRNAVLTITTDAPDQPTLTVTLVGEVLPACDTIDFNRDGLTPDSGDLDDFLAVLSGGPSACSTFPAPGCGDLDYNNDGLFPDSLDLDAFISRLAGGACLR
jgi:hypothetical protein